METDVVRLIDHGVWSIVLMPEAIRCYSTAYVYDLTYDRVEHYVTWRSLKHRFGLWYELEGLEVEHIADPIQMPKDFVCRFNERAGLHPDAMPLVYGAEMRRYPHSILDGSDLDIEAIIDSNAEQHKALRAEPEYWPSIGWMVENQDSLQDVAPEPYKGRDLRYLAKLIQEKGWASLMDLSRIPPLPKPQVVDWSI